MASRWAYLSLFIAGTVLPMVAFAPWLLQHGLDLSLFGRELFANRISTFFAIDLLLTALVVLLLAIRERRRLELWWLPILVTLGIGVSAGLPLLLYLRAAPDAGRNSASE